MPRPPVPRSVMWSIASIGVFAGHALTYAVLAPVQQTRTQLLASTGHGYLPAGVHAGLALSIVGLAAVFLGRLGNGRAGPTATFPGLASRVIGFQSLTFIAIELAERIVAHAPLHDLTHVVPVGVLAQIVVGLVVAGAIMLMIRAADAAAEILGSPARGRPRDSLFLRPPPIAIPVRSDRIARGGRGPPR